MYPSLLAGLALFTVLIAYQGVGEVAAALAVAGWGLAWVALFHVVPMAADAMGWRRLLAGRGAPPARTMLLARWIGESVNALLPVMQVGGNVAKARLLARRGVAADVAGASVVVDVTLVVVTQIAFTLVGLTLLVVRLGGDRAAPAALAGAGIMAALVGGFVAAQRRGLFGTLTRTLERVGGRRAATALSEGATAMDEAVHRLHRDRRALVGAAAWHFGSWIVGTGEVWIALHLLGHPVGWPTALLLESLVQAVRAAAFAVPGALGIQEGGYLVLGGTLGLAPETCLALSLTKRVRDLVLGLPGLAVWQLDGVERILAGGVRTRGATGA